MIVPAAAVGFKPVVNYRVGQSPVEVALADLNGDGKQDLAILNVGSNSAGGSVSILLGNGDGTFQSARNFDVNAKSIAVADFNGDHKLDLAAIAQSGNVDVVVGTGTGTFQPVATYPASSDPFGVASAIATGDFNGDGKIDIAFVGSSQQQTYNVGTLAIIVGNGDGTFAPPATRAITTPRDVVAADFSADGRTDLAVLSSALSPLAIMLRIGPSVTIAPSSLAFAATPARFTSPPRTLTVSNTGTDDLHIALAGLSGANAADFSKVADHCSGATIAAGASCTIDLVFKPRTVGAKAASLRIVDDAGTGLQSTALQGTGLIKYPRSETVAPHLAPAPSPATPREGPPPPPPPGSGTQPVRLFRLLLL